ncbi:hypothetical protein HK105_200482 [Polyrhizophydium stewartii]|uniref:NAD(P)-binding protein n=1 Tax=Polyrhizophydium stewartii TaxID=2732419 RepID=A0ABR4NJ72_9FUNG|nr:hypothetical protein HK105_007003 [Polyrhizophydium stewartii]
MGLSGRHVVITGGSGGVGVAVAKAFLERGCHVTIQFNTNPGPAEPLAAQYPSHCTLLQAQVTDEKQVAGLFTAAIERHGPVEVLVVSHGIWPAEDVGVKDMSLDRWRNTIAVNLDGTFLFVREFLRQLETAVKSNSPAIEAPAIVLVGSTAGKFGEAWHADYSASKTAMMYGLISSLKNEIVKVHPRARINTVSPGWIRTPMAERALQDPSLLFQALASTPLKKVSEPHDVAQAILFLADANTSGNITGVSLDLNGGMEGRMLNRLEDFQN